MWYAALSIPSQPHLVKHFGSTEEGEQCAVAEFVCGMIRASLLWDESSAADFERVKRFAVRALQEAVLNRQLTIEMITMYVTVRLAQRLSRI